jgi:uncharacterized protein (TIGR02996 family)
MPKPTRYPALDALLLAYRDEPTDDTRRLVIADCLAEVGDAREGDVRAADPAEVLEQTRQALAVCGQAVEGLREAVGDLESLALDSERFQRLRLAPPLGEMAAVVLEAAGCLQSAMQAAERARGVLRPARGQGGTRDERGTETLVGMGPPDGPTRRLAECL